MKKRALLIALLAVAGCKKSDKKDEPAKGSGTGGTQTQPMARPSQGTLAQMPAVEQSTDPQHQPKVDLGHALFFDKRLSVDGTASCYSCHQNEDGNGGHNPTAIGPGGKKLPRHSPVIWNVGYWKGALYWDGRSPTLEAQAIAALTGGNMGVPEADLPKKVTELAKVAGYKAMFEAAFPKQAVTPDLVAQALSEYERTLVCNDTAYDKFAGGDKAALDEAQQRGLDTFLGKGQCSTCHTPPFFSAAMNLDGGAYFNAGIGTDKPEADVDVGRMKVSSAAGDWAAFKPPSLRNVTKSAPYFHDGSAADLDAVFKVMTGGGIKNKNLSPLFGDRGLTDDEKADLKAFLGALACPGTLDEPKLP